MKGLMVCFLAHRSMPPFQLGEQPSGDVFSSPAKKTSRTVDNASAESETGDAPVNVQAANNDRRVARSVTTGNLALASPVERALNSSSMSARHKIGGVDVQGIYPATACVFVAK